MNGLEVGWVVESKHCSLLVASFTAFGLGNSITASPPRALIAARTAVAVWV
jgi:hypothetical protein